MRSDLITYKDIYSSFLSCDKDIQKILKTLFISSKPYSDILKRLLVINNPDCLDMSNQTYKKVINSMSLSDLIDKGYIRLNPKVSRKTHEEIKTYIIITLDNFLSAKASDEYRDYNINFDIICYNDAWDLDDYKNRPLLIAGYIDGILNSITNNQRNGRSFKSNIKLTGIGRYNFLNCTLHVLNEDFSMYSLSYRGEHFSEDLQRMESLINQDV